MNYFIRTLWGQYAKSKKYLAWRSKITQDIQRSVKSEFTVPYRTYVFGDDNLKFLSDQGVADLVLVDKRPYIFDPANYQFRHKLEAFKLGMQDFDRIVFLDWDVVLQKPLPVDFWDVLSQKQPLQAVLRGYRRRFAYWRKECQRRIPSASFVYIGDKSIPDKLIQLWDVVGKPNSEEVPMARYTDDLLGGWQGIEKYWDNFEPDYCILDGEGAVYPPDRIAQKHRVFSNFNAKI